MVSLPCAACPSYLPSTASQVRAGGVGEVGAVDPGVAVEQQPPGADRGEPDGVVVQALVAEVHHHDDIVTGTSVGPAVEGHHVVGVVGVEDVEVLTGQAPRAALDVAAQVDQVAVETHDAGELSSLSHSRGTSSRNHSPWRNSWPWKSMGIPGAVRTSAAPSVERFWEYQPVGSSASTSYGTRARPFATSSCDSV